MTHKVDYYSFILILVVVLLAIFFSKTNDSQINLSDIVDLPEDDVVIPIDLIEDNKKPMSLVKKAALVSLIVGSE